MLSLLSVSIAKRGTQEGNAAGSVVLVEWRVLPHNRCSWPFMRTIPSAPALLQTALPVYTSGRYYCQTVWEMLSGNHLSFC